MRDVLARHRVTGEQRNAVLDEEESTLTDELGNQLDRMWEYDELSPGFRIVLCAALLLMVFGMLLIFSGASK